MTRKFTFACVLGVFLSTAAWSQKDLQNSPPSDRNPGSSTSPAATQQPPEETEPPEEDEALKPRTYAFDPLEAERNIKVGNFYMRKGGPSGYRAAAGRFEDATRYDPKNAEAYLRLGEAEEKLKHKEKAEAAFRRVVELSPNSKIAKEAQKKLGHHS